MTDTLRRITVAALLTLTAAVAAGNLRADEPPRLVVETAGAITGMLRDKTKWHRLPDHVKKAYYVCGQKPTIVMRLPERCDRSEVAAMLQASAGWPFLLQDVIYSSSSLDGRILSRNFGYFDGRSWHATDQHVEYYLPPWMVWFPGGAAGATKEPYGVRFFHNGQWRFHDCDYEGRQKESYDLVKIQPGAGGTMTAFVPLSAEPTPPPVLHLWDGRTWRALTRDDGLPDDLLSYAVCVAPGKLWVLSQQGFFNFVDLARGEQNREHQLTALIEAYPEASRRERDAILAKLRRWRRDAVRLVQAQLAASGSVPSPDTERIEEEIRHFRTVLEVVRGFAQQLDETSIIRAGELEQKLEDHTDRLARARDEFENALARRPRYDAMLELLEALVTGRLPDGESRGRLRVEWKAVDGVEPTGHAWLKTRRNLVERWQNQGEALVRLAPDGTRQAVCELEGIFDADVVISPRNGPYMVKPDGSGLWRWNGRQMEHVIGPQHWSDDMVLEGCDDDGWICISRTAERSVTGVVPDRPEYWLIRPEAEDTRLRLETVRYEGMKGGWKLADGRIVAMAGSRLRQFRAGQWSDLCPQDVRHPDGVVAGQDGGTWLMSPDNDKVQAIHRGELVMSGPVAELCRQRFEEVFRTAPRRAFHTLGPLRVGNHLWLVDKKYPACFDGQEFVSLRDRLPKELAKCDRVLLTGPMDDGRTVSLLAFHSPFRYTAHLRVEEDGSVTVVKLQSYKAEGWPSLWLDLPHFDPRGRILGGSIRDLEIVGVETTTPVKCAGLPTLVDRFGRIWTTCELNGLQLVKEGRLHPVLDANHGYFRPVWVPQEDRAYVTNNVSILELRDAGSDRWSVGRRFHNIDWKLPAQQFVGAADGYAVFSCSGRGRYNVTAVKLP